jgi:hypothetical protein
LTAKYTGKAFSTLVNDQQMDGYTLLNLAAGYKLPSTGFFKAPEVRLNVDNLANTSVLAIAGQVRADQGGMNLAADESVNLLAVGSTPLAMTDRVRSLGDVVVTAGKGLRIVNAAGADAAGTFGRSDGGEGGSEGGEGGSGEAADDGDTSAAVSKLLARRQREALRESIRNGISTGSWKLTRGGMPVNTAEAYDEDDEDDLSELFSMDSWVGSSSGDSSGDDGNG